MANNPKRRDDMLAVERIIDECSNEDGEYHKTAAIEKVAEHLIANPDSQQAFDAARALVDAYEAAHKPRARGGGNGQQDSLWDPDGVLVLGDGFRVRMRRAKRAHVISAMQIRQQAYQREVADFMRDQSYYLSRVAAFRTDDETLEDVERRFSDNLFNGGDE